MKKMSLVLSFAVAIVWTASADFDRFIGHYLPTNAAETVASYESLRTMLPVCGTSPVTAKDGTTTFNLDNLQSPFGRSPKGDERFIVELYSRVSVYPGLFYEARFKHDKAAYEKWKADHPGFLYFFSDELGNDAYMKWRVPDELRCLGNPECGKNPVSEKVWKEVVSRKIPPTREEYVEKVLKPHFDRVVEWHFGDVGSICMGDGIECITHLFANWGVKAISIETTRPYKLWQIQEMFCRGAAHQFGIPWHWYIASFFGPYTLFAEPDPAWSKYGPTCGLSLSAMKRATYLTWLSGASSYWREATDNTHFLWRNGGGAISPEGRMYDAFYNFIKGRDRGTPVTPIALLVPACRGYSRECGKAFPCGYAYTHPDRMLDTVMSVILDFPRNHTLELEQRHEERVMANTKYGDVFDALTPDFREQSAFRRTIGDYKAAVLIGDYGRNAEMEGILVDYVKRGGTLVLNAAQLGGALDETFTGVRIAGEEKRGDSLFSKLVPTTARVMKSVVGGGALFTSNRFGAGEVVVASEHYLSPWQDGGKEAEARNLADAKKTPVAHPDVAWLFDRLEEKTVPVSVKGFIQWGLNRTKDGHLLYLINNAGVEKEMDKAPKIAPGGERVEIDLRKIPHVSVRELMTNADLGPGDFVELVVPYGDLAVLEIR